MIGTIISAGCLERRLQLSQVGPGEGGIVDRTELGGPHCLEQSGPAALDVANGSVGVSGALDYIGDLYCFSPLSLTSSMAASSTRRELWGERERVGGSGPDRTSGTSGTDR